MLRDRPRNAPRLRPQGTEPWLQPQIAPVPLHLAGPLPDKTQSRATPPGGTSGFTRLPQLEVGLSASAWPRRSEKSRNRRHSAQRNAARLRDAAVRTDARFAQFAERFFNSVRFFLGEGRSATCSSRRPKKRIEPVGSVTSYGGQHLPITAMEHWVGGNLACRFPTCPCKYHSEAGATTSRNVAIDQRFLNRGDLRCGRTGDNEWHRYCEVLFEHCEVFHEHAMFCEGIVNIYRPHCEPVN
jgi:hypothetical protein